MADSILFLLAPGHDERDRRVNRTVEVFSGKFNRVVLIYELRFSSGIDVDLPKNVTVLYVDNTTPKLKVVPQLAPFIKVISSYGLPVNNIYIHDSGLFGLFLAKKLKSRFPQGSKIILDYHDFVPWEVHYQLEKLITNNLFNKIIGYFLLKVLSLYFRLGKTPIFDGAVGISSAQVKNILGWLGCPNAENWISIPNTRDKIALEGGRGRLSVGTADFLWVGNIVEGRDLPHTLSYLDELSQVYSFKLYVFGKIISPYVYRLLLDRPYFMYMGEFKSDVEMLGFCQNNKVLGVFFGWDDKYSVGINEIASPNKVYSYMNLGIPVLIHNKVNPSVFSKNQKIGKGFDDFVSFKDSYRLMSDDYSGYKEAAIKSRDECVWESDLGPALSQFVDKIYFGVRNV
ncbi:glycosyltransferase family 4 protein [Aliidiomarina halalkaliphila]|uniref:Glycosyltransferase family 4 protein n=1 Tax=Aliidiomarina halalkaliphila TaxID=2593535 RepID=A0A552X588_9GAMM|nr:glycosyltransferase family 4 protein [Aliidiomarina halalkaliphila]TRW50191.1 glycosyltransferase family 4 protein [Aliidiomarina halalkaliphila]